LGFEGVGDGRGVEIIRMLYMVCFHMVCWCVCVNGWLRNACGKARWAVHNPTHRHVQCVAHIFGWLLSSKQQQHV
jgi:hypothetical protein